MKICFLGGSFDPPHLGHLEIAKGCLKQFQKFIFIPSNHSPNKQKPPYFSSKHRLKMLEILIQDYKDIQIDRFEIDSKNKISYTIDTIKYLRNKYKNIPLYMVIGSDLINDIESWKEWSQIKEKVRVICFKRSGYNNITFDDNNILLLNSVNLSISSSSIKSELFSDRSNNFSNFSSMISKPIYDYIYDNKLTLKH